VRTDYQLSLPGHSTFALELAKTEEEMQWLIRTKWKGWRAVRKFEVERQRWLRARGRRRER
jgi:hypothetical protein